MVHVWEVPQASEAELCRVAEYVALKLAAGDTVALSGELGAGKTTFARALVRAVLVEPGADVPSPTFSLMQLYESPRLTLAHLDLYRISSADEAAELGSEEVLVRGALIVEWPERAPGVVSENRLEIRLSETGAADTRSLHLAGHGTWGPRLRRLEAMHRFLGSSNTSSRAAVTYLQGDASARAYARLATGAARAILMDSPRQPDGPPIRDGLSYSRIAHLAEDVRPFVAVAEILRSAGLSAPEIHAADLDQGFLVLEDLGDRVFGYEIAAGTAQDELWQHATDVLVELCKLNVPSSVPLPDGTTHTIPPFDRGVCEIETSLLLDWYWPALKGSPVTSEVRAEFEQTWAQVINRLLAAPAGLILRDYHSPNLIWLPERQGIRRVGIIDFQDALVGPPAYDLVSLLQDARLDVPAELETALFKRYCSAVMKNDSRFDGTNFAYSYAALGAQRNTKILGIFARLAVRDRKPGYLAHIPRIWRYLERDLAHPELQRLRSWYDHYLSPAIRGAALRT